MDKKNSYKFKKNESFYIRDGWFEKALNTIADDNEYVFSKNNGPRYLGIGANMAKSLKYWFQASNLAVSISSKTILTETGESIFKYDRYFESDFTWYLIHYNLCSNRFECPIFYSFFNSNIKKINKNDLVAFLVETITDDEQEIKQNYIEDDLSVFLKSYVNDEVNLNPEDNYICPLSNLKLIKKYGSMIEKEKPFYAKLPSELIYYGLSKIYNYESFNIEDSYDKENSPYLIFNLDKNAYLQYLEELQRNGLLTINKTAGLNTVYFEKKIELPELFKMHFGGRK